jgi:osmotically-inducible protein OsmY
MRSLTVIVALGIGIGAAGCDRSISGARPDNPDRKDPSPTATSPAPVETMDVKAALIADKTIDASDINVDTFADTKTVVLKGTVPTQEQREAAARVAAREATGYTIDNRLTVKVP